jgi:tRNA(His) 5'-end guanylyltransferase
MRPQELERQMRALEIYHPIRLPPGAWVILRLDGRGFSRLTADRFAKPFNLAFHELMADTTQVLLEEFQGLYAFTESDEISLLFPRAWDLFDRELEKLVSLSAALASSTFALAASLRVQFDSRALPVAADEQVLDYFRWRQADAGRCALNGWCYWTLRQEGRGVAEATAALQGLGVAAKNELLFRRGINFNGLPAWQRRGTGVYWETFQREGFNPRLGQTVVTTRRRLRVDRDLPLGDAYADLLRRLMTGGTA